MLYAGRRTFFALMLNILCSCQTDEQRSFLAGKRHVPVPTGGSSLYCPGAVVTMDANGRPQGQVVCGPFNNHGRDMLLDAVDMGPMQADKARTQRLVPYHLLIGPHDGRSPWCSQAIAARQRAGFRVGEIMSVIYDVREIGPEGEIRPVDMQPIGLRLRRLDDLAPAS